MAKENVRKVLGVTAAVFAQLGQISKEEALEMSGLDAKSFEEAANRAKKAEEELKAGKKEASFYDIVSKATAEYMDGIRK